MRKVKYIEGFAIDLPPDKFEVLMQFLRGWYVEEILFKEEKQRGETRLKL